jgi:hypothetical protein
LDESEAVWDNGGDTVTLTTEEGVSVVEYAY